jgi:transposase
MPKTQADCLFDVSLSSFKRCTKLARQGESLVSKKGGGRSPKADEATNELLKEDIE